MRAASMRIAAVVAPGKIQLEEAPVPAPVSGEVLVRVRAVGLCGSDLQYFAQGRIGDHRLPAGHILGHEVAGTVEALGPDTEGPPPGTLVAVDPAIPCNRCRFCVEGNPNFCRSLRFCGSPPTPGGLSEFLVHPVSLILPLPTTLRPAVGAAIEALGVAIHAVDLGHLAAGDSVAVFGCGPIGLLIARLAHLAGARRVYATEPLDHRRKVAPLFGAVEALDPGRDDVVSLLREGTGGDGVDVAFEAAGSEEATAQAVAAVRPGGALVLLGYWKSDRVSLPGIQAMRKGLTVRFVRRMKRTFPRAIHLVDQGQVDLAALISHEFPFGDVAHAFARAERRVPDILKAVVTMGDRA